MYFTTYLSQILYR